MIFHEISAMTIAGSPAKVPIMIPGTKDARELIAFYLDSGADALIGEEPVDRMADQTKPPLPSERGRLDGETVQVGASNQTARGRRDLSPDRFQRPDPPVSGEGKSRTPISAPASP